MKLKLTRKGYLIISVCVLVLVFCGAIYAYISSQIVRDLVGKLIGQQSKATNTTPSSLTPSPVPTPSPSPIASSSPNSSPTPSPSTSSTNTTDVEIKSNILQAIIKNPEWRENEMEILVNNGAVTLKGVINDQNQHTAIEVFIRSLSGVKNLTNSLEVKPINLSTISPVSTKENSDDLLAKEVEFACYKTDAFEIKTMKFSAKDGHVTLSGKVRSRAEKLLAERVAKETLGVKSIINDLEVKQN